MTRVISILFIFATASLTTLAQNYLPSSPVVVSGVVVDDQGVPVARAVVAAMSIQRSGVAGQLSSTQSDKDGQFRIDLGPGAYLFRAKAEAQGFPDPNFLLSRDPKAVFPRVTVGEENVSGIRIVLGQKGGIIEGDLLDSQSHEPIVCGKITIRDSSNVNAYVEITTDRDGRFRFTIPSRQISISATAPGYRGAQFSEGAVRLSGGEHRSISIKLERQSLEEKRELHCESARNTSPEKAWTRLAENSQALQLQVRVW